MSVTRNSHRFLPWAVLTILVLLAPGQAARAVIVSRFNPADPSADYNITAPTDDPGWYNVSDNSAGFSSSFVYLGDQWVLTAGHVAAGTLRLANGTFDYIPGTEYQLTNPAGNYWQVNFEGNRVNAPLATHTDLRIFRVNTDTATGLRPEDLNPGIKPTSIASSAPANGTDVVMIGIGVNRVVNVNDVNQEGLYHFDVNKSTNPWTWSSPLDDDEGTNYRGFESLPSNPSLPRTKRWGTNEISPDTQIEQGFGINDGDNNVVTTRFRTNGTKITDTLNLVARFDQLGPNSDEAMARAGDSGGPVFYKNAAGEWQLGGIMNSIYPFIGQPIRYSIYGNWTAFADLSNPHYHQQIADKLGQSHYSIMGDINLDGVVSGDGSGTWETDDVAAFVQGWAYSQPSADILSWKHGDLNQDGATNIADFVLLRDSLGGTIAGGQNLGGGGPAHAVPEPQGWLLLLGIMSGLWWLLRPRRRWAMAPVRRRSQ